MAFKPSRTRHAPFLAKRETTIGTDSSPAGAADGLGVNINSPNPIQLRQTTFELRTHGNTLTRRKHVIGSSFWIPRVAPTDEERVRAVVDAWTPKQRAIAYTHLYALGLRIDTATREAR